MVGVCYLMLRLQQNSNNSDSSNSNSNQQHYRNCNGQERKKLQKKKLQKKRKKQQQNRKKRMLLCLGSMFSAGYVALSYHKACNRFSLKRTCPYLITKPLNYILFCVQLSSDMFYSFFLLLFVCFFFFFASFSLFFLCTRIAFQLCVALYYL